MKKHKIVISVFVVLIITIIAFSPSLKNDFTNWDDNELVTGNKIIKVLTWSNVKKLFTSLHVGTYIPLTILSYSIEYYFFKLDPRAYHTTNVILHLLNCLLVFWLIYLLSGKVSISFLVTLFFGIHPLRVESVAWITERKDVLYAFFFLSTLISYIYYRRSLFIKYYLFSLFLFISSLLAKPMAITLPVFLLIFDYHFQRRFDRNLWLEKGPFFAITLVFGMIAILGQESVRLMGAQSLSTFLYNFLSMNYLLGFYLGKIFMPIRLSCVYHYPVAIDSLLHPAFLISTLSIAILIIAVIYFGRYTRKIVFGSLFFLIAILPVIQPLFGKSMAGDRYTYISSIGLFYLVAEGFFWLYRKKLKTLRIIKSLLLITFFVIIGILSTLTFKRCRIWKDSITLWSDVIEKYPDILMAYHNRGLAYYDKGEYNEAIADYTYILNIDPNHINAHFNRGNAYEAIKGYSKAVADFTHVLGLVPDDVTAYKKRGINYGRIGEYEKAITDFTQVLRVNPEDMMAYYWRGVTYFLLEDYNKALADLTKALSINPKYADAYYYRANTYFVKKEYEKAWEDIKTYQDLGYQFDSKLVEQVRKSLGSQK